jgi:hypothetical protein
MASRFTDGVAMRINKGLEFGKVACTLWLSMLMASCGGGGGSSAPSASTAQAPGAAASGSRESGGVPADPGAQQGSDASDASGAQETSEAATDPAAQQGDGSGSADAASAQPNDNATDNTCASSDPDATVAAVDKPQLPGTDVSFARVDWLDPVVRTDSEDGFILVAGRDIFLRAFMTSSAGPVQAPPVLLQVSDGSGALLHQKIIYPQGALKSQLDPGVTGDLRNPTGTFRYKICGQWIQPGVQIKLGIQASDLSAGNNTWTSTPPVDRARTFYVTVAPFRIGDEDPAYLPNQTQGDDAIRQAVKADLMAGYPFTDVKVRVIRTPIQSALATGTRNWGTLVSELKAFESADFASANKPSSSGWGYYMGLVKILPGAAVLGQSIEPGWTVTMQAPNQPDGTETNNWRGTMLHELGHNFGLGHLPCEPIDPANQEWGYDARSDVMVPPTDFVLMDTACPIGSPPAWWRHSTYVRIQDYVRAHLASPPAALSRISEWQ